jgi:hypothetical protein
MEITEPRTRQEQPLVLGRGPTLNIGAAIHGLDRTKAMPTSASAAPQRTSFHPSGWSQPTMATNPLWTLQQRFACARLPQLCLRGSCPDFSATFTTEAFDRSSLR